MQWWRRLSAVERVERMLLTRWSSGRGESNLRTQTKCPLPTQGWHTGLTKNVHVPKGTRGHPTPRRVGCPPVVSAQSQLSTCEDARDDDNVFYQFVLAETKNRSPIRGDMGGFGVREWGKASWGEEFGAVLLPGRFPSPPPPPGVRGCLLRSVKPEEPFDPQ